MSHDFFFDREHETLPRAEIESHQRSRLTEMLEVIYRQNGFYQRKFREAGGQRAPKGDCLLYTSDSADVEDR